MSRKTKNKNTAQQSLGGSNTYHSLIAFMPVILILAIVPLILRWNVIPLDENIAKFWIDSTETDLFCYSKSVAIMILSFIMLAEIFFTLDRKSIKNDRLTKIMLGAVAVFAAVSILSTVTSEYKHVAMWGAPERHEGLVLQLCYMLMLLYTYFTLKNTDDFRYIKYSLMFLAGVMFIIGFSQMLNKDILGSDFVHNLVIPEKYKDSLTPEPTNGLVYLTLMHYNYVGSYAGLIIPFFAVLALSNHENKIMRAVMGTISVLTAIILVKCNSQAGLVGVALSALAIAFIYFNTIFKNKKLLIGAIVVVIASGTIANLLSGGLLVHNAMDILVDAKKIFVQSSDYVHDPTYGLPVYDVKADGNKVRIETVDGQLNMEFKDALRIEFTDASGKPVENVYSKENLNYTFAPPYDKLVIMESDKSTSSYSQIAMNYGDFTYYILEFSKGEAYLIDSRAYRYELEVAPHIGFEGSEKVGSMRGYIWSRTLPLIAKKPLLGYGPDNFLMAFPQYDMVAKTYAYDTPFMIVDKPHNIYLLYAINSGIFATLSMIVLWGAYIIDSLKLYALKKEYSKGDYYGVACLVSVIGYLGAGFFNDSVPVIAPVFWIILGTGFAINYLNKKAEKTI